MHRERLTVWAGLVAALLIASQPTLAQGPGWTVVSTVQQLVVTYDGWINVRLSPDLVGCTSHSGYGQQFASIPVTHPGLASIQANLLTAYVTGTPLSDGN